MKAKVNRNYRNRRTFAQHLQATFGRIDSPRAGRKSLLTLGIVCLLITGAASADWRVYDQRVHEQLRDEITPRIGNVNAGEGGGGSVTGNQKLIYDQHRVRGEHFNPEKDEETKTKLAETPDFPDNDISTGTIESRRCGNKKTPDDQRAVCETIVRMEEERYEYLQGMKKISEKRSEELKAIYEERKGIKEEEYGKLQSNTNRLLALLAQQRIDQLNMDMAMATFDERIRDREEYKNYLAEVAMDPSKKKGIDLGDIIGGFARTEILDKALEMAGERQR